MKICFVLPKVSPSGGIKVALIYAKKLSEMGHMVTVVSAKEKPLSFRQIVRSILNFEWPRVRAAVSLEGWSGNHLILNEHEIAEGRVFPNSDVVIATWWETAEWVERLPPCKGTKVYFIQGHEVFDFLPTERVIATYKLPFHRIVISNWLMRTLQDSYGIGKLDLVPNSYDQTQFFATARSKSAIPTIGFLYSQTGLKGSDVAIAAILMLQVVYPNIHVISFGTRSPRSDGPIVGNFEFHLLPKQDEIRTLYSRCDVWLTGSRSEGFNLTALEAMACRTPLVSTRTGWPCDSIVDGENGYLVEVDDVESLASAVEKILLMPDCEWQKMSLEAFKTASFGSWDISAKAFESSLLKCLELKHFRQQRFQ